MSKIYLKPKHTNFEVTTNPILHKLNHLFLC